MIANIICGFACFNKKTVLTKTNVDKKNSAKLLRARVPMCGGGLVMGIVMGRRKRVNVITSVSVYFDVEITRAKCVHFSP